MSRWPLRLALLALLSFVVGFRPAEAGPPSASPTSARCATNASCQADQYCDHEPGLCGQGPIPGTCRPRPTSCSAEVAPVCGCDGSRHPSPCEAARDGVDLRVTGGCADVPALIACGASFCDPRVSYCEIVLSDVAELPTDRICRPLPDRCLGGDVASMPCACFPQGTRCASFCGRVDTGDVTGFRLTCRS